MPDLEAQTLLVAGGAGEVGEGIVRQLLARGARVIVPSRRLAKLEQLRTRLDGPSALVTLVGEVGTLEGAAALRATIAHEVGPLDGVVASLGGWWQGLPITQVSLELWHTLLDNSLTAHFVVARTFLPDLATRLAASYTLINGAGGLNPVPTAGPVSVSAAGQLMLGKVLAAEMAHTAVRVNNLVLGTPIITRSRPHGGSSWLSADDAGRYVAYLASSHAAHVRGETIVFEHRWQMEE